MAIGVMNNKTTAVRIIPVPGREVGEMVEFGGLLGKRANHASEQILFRAVIREAVGFQRRCRACELRFSLSASGFLSRLCVKCVFAAFCFTQRREVNT